MALVPAFIDMLPREDLKGKQFSWFFVPTCRYGGFSLYAIKVACTAGKKKATLFLERIGSGAIRYQSKKGG
jgi:hypothetical protein